MKFGLFDHIDRSDRPLAQQLDERLELVAAADRAGFYCLHVAEHHATPLNMIPVPGVYLGAVARVTKTLRFGPMVYLLPLYSPLRLLEEIAILDQLSHGRLEVGVGRGVSSFELNYHHVDVEHSREIFADAFACIKEGLTHERLTYKGPYYQYDDVPMVLKPLQQPYPAFWYGSSNATGATWAGEQGLHFASNGGSERAKGNIDAFKAALARRGGADVPHPEFPGGVAIGVSRTIVVADTDEAAHRIAKPALAHLHDNLNHLRRESLRLSGGDPNSPLVGMTANNPSAGDFDAGLAEGSVIAGSPETVRAAIEHQVRYMGINYLIGYFMFGTMQLNDAMRSLHLFNTEVRPHVEHLEPAAV